MSTKRIDTHFHIILPSFIQAVRAAGDDPAGWVVTEWSPQGALEAMDKMGVTKTLLSHTSPGPGVCGPNEEGKKLCRSMNVDTLAVVKQYPDRFGWYANLPNWHDVEGTIEEVKWALNEAKADGFVIMSTYDDVLLGDAKFQPIWAALNELKAVLFLHPAQLNIKPKWIAGNVPQPLIDYPLATTRTAIDLVLTKTLAKNPDVKVILSHAGGTLPFLADRVLSLVGLFGMSAEDAKRDMQRFYLDVALSTSRSQLQILLEFTTPDKLVFGSDWPYVNTTNALRLISQLDDYISKHPASAELDQAIYYDNAAKLFGWT